MVGREFGSVPVGQPEMNAMNRNPAQQQRPEPAEECRVQTEVIVFISTAVSQRDGLRLSLVKTLATRMVVYWMGNSRVKYRLMVRCTH